MKRILLLVTLLILCGSVFSQTWQPIGPFKGEDKKGKAMHTMGYVSEVYMDPENQNEIFMATNSSGFFKTKNRGENWNCTTDSTDLIPGMGIQGIVANPNNKNIMLAAASNFNYGCDTYYARVLISYDRGDSWSILKSFETEWKEELIKILYKNDKEVYVATSSHLYYSNDDLNSWKTLFKLDKKQYYIEHTAQQIVDFELLENETILMSTTQKWGATGQVWRTTNNGENWDALIISDELKGLKNKHVMCVKIGSPIKNKSVIAVSIASDIFIYKSIDNAKSYTRIGEFKTNYETGDAKASKFEIELSKQDTNKIYFGFIEFFDWTPIQGLRRLSPTQNISDQEHDDVRRMKVYINSLTNKEYLLMGNDGGVSMYYPDESLFESLNGDSLNTVQIYNMGMSQYGDDFKILIGTQDNGTFQYQNNDWKWVSGGDGGAAWLSNEGDKQFYCMNATLLFKEGNTRRYFTPNRRNTSWFLNYPAEMKPDNNTIVFGSGNAGGKGAKLYIQPATENNLEGIEIDKVAGIGSIAISENNGDIIYIAGNDFNDKNDNTPRLFKTINGGDSFIDLTKGTVYSSSYNDTLTLFDLLSYRLITDIEIDPLDDEIIYLSISGVSESDANKIRANMHVLKSYDAGNSWVDFSEGLPVFPVHILKRHAGAKELIFCGTDKGIYYREKGDNRWSEFNIGFPQNQSVSDLKVNYCQNKLYAATFGRGIWRIDIPLSYKEANQKITNDTEWKFKEKFQLTDLIIKKGRELEISGDLILAKNCKVILEPKSKLILNGAEIKTKCAGDWEKIIIKEKKFLFFFKRKKGKVITIDTK
jgi:photosystem II stability/assembly factor-like uncharacterized protein